MLSSKTFQNLSIVKLNAVIWLSKLGCHGNVNADVNVTNDFKMSPDDF